MPAKNLLLALASVVVTLAGVEALFRVLQLDAALLGDPLRDVPVMAALVPDPYLQWRGRAQGRFPWIPEPLNERGFRGPAPRSSKPAHVRRVAVLGDSCTFGVVRREGSVTALRRPYPARVQELLDREQAGRFEVVNYGVIGYTTWHGLRQLHAEVLADAPDLVVIRFGWNDLFASPLERSFAAPRRAALERLERWLYASRLLGVLLHRGIPRRREGYALEQLASRPTTWVGPEDYAFHLERMIELARERHAATILLDAPAAPLTPEIDARALLLFETGYASFERLLEAHRLYQEITARVARERGVAWLRTAPAPGRETDAYFSRFDLVHPDAGGHARIAELLHAAILDALRPPGRG
jgi:lysophospholipase L1-like esterase